MPTFLSRFQRFSNLGLLTLAVFIVAAALYWSQLLSSQQRLYQEALQRNEARGRQLVAAVAQQLDTLMQSYDLAARHLRDDYLLQPRQFDNSVRTIRNAFPKEAIKLILVYDANGYLAYSSDGSKEHTYFGDREHVRVHFERAEDQLYVGKPVMGRLGKEWVIMLTRPIRQNGQLVGVIGLSLRPAYLTERLSALSLQETDSLNISRSDGPILARTGDLDQAMGKSLPAERPSVNAWPGKSGIYRDTSVVDHIPRMYAWQRLSHWPLVVIIGIDEARDIAYIVDNNRESRWYSAFATGLFLLLALGLTNLFLRFDRQRQQLRESEQRYRCFFENNSSVKLLIDPSDDRIVDANKAAGDYYGYSHEQLLTMKISDINILPTDKLHEEIAQARSQGRTYFNFQHRLASGDIRDVEVYSGPVDMGGKTMLFSIVHDITLRKELERRLVENEALTSSVLYGAAFAIIASDLQGRITIFNRGAENLLGYRAEEVIGKCTPLLWHDAAEITSRAQQLSEELQRPVEPGFACFVARTHSDGTPDEGEWTFIRKDGRRIPVLLSVTAIRDSRGRVNGYIGISHDISASKAAEAELRRSNAELEQFAYAASHDMRQPLRMIVSYLQLLEKSLHGQLSKDDGEFLGFAVDGARRLDQMLLSLLEYSRVGRKGDEKSCFPSRDALDEALRYLQPAINECQAQITVEGTWPEIFGSRDEIMRLFQNLVGNAIKYRRPDIPPAIIIHADTDRQQWQVSITDNGAGFAPSQANRLFQVFQRLHSRSQYEGSGVGLAICRKIIEHHGGSISGSSPGDGQGCCFTFNLPLNEETQP